MPHDRHLKSVIADDPYALYRLVRSRAPSEDAVLQPMVQKLPAPLPEADYWFTVTEADRCASADIFEFKARYDSGMAAQLVDYTLRAHLRAHVPVRGFLFVMTGLDFPKSYQEIPPLEIPGILSIRFETILLFDTSASLALEYDKPSLLSLAPYMKATREELLAAARKRCARRSS